MPYYVSIAVQLLFLDHVLQCNNRFVGIPFQEEINKEPAYHLRCILNYSFIIGLDDGMVDAILAGRGLCQ